MGYETWRTSVATRGAAMWKSSRFMGQGHVCNPLPNSLTSPVKQATPPPHREPQIPSVQYLVPCWGPALTTGQLPIHRAVLRSSPPQGILQEAPLSLTKPSYYPTPRELPPCPLTCNPSRYAHISQRCHRKFILIMEMNGNHTWNHTAFSL